jgi:hypothetical protein
MSLVEHAERELAAIGCAEPERSALIKAVAAFAEGGWSGGGAPWGISVLTALLQFKNLGPLTDDPDEWMSVAEESNGQAIWQSRRNPEAFSIDAGKTYYLLSEREAYQGTIGTYTGPEADGIVQSDDVTPIHTSVTKEAAASHE